MLCNLQVMILLLLAVFTFSALILLVAMVGQQEGHPACKN